MKQSRTMSLVEAVANVAVGFAVAMATQIVVFPVFGLEATLQDHLQIGALFTVVSIARSYLLRRLFERIRDWKAPHMAALSEIRAGQPAMRQRRS